MKKKQKEKYVFISYYKGDKKYIGRLKEIIKASTGWKLKSYPIDIGKENNASHEGYISKKMERASAVIRLIGPETHRRKFVNWEIEHASKEGKKIIGVFLKKLDVPLPSGIEDHADAIIDWDPRKIIKAINDKKIFCNPDGSERLENTDSSKKMKRVLCQRKKKKKALR